MDNVEIKKSNLEAAYKQADDNTKKLLTTLFGDAVTTKDDRPVTERIKTFEDACKELGEEHPLVKEWNCWQGCCSADLAAYLKLRIICAALNEGWEPQLPRMNGGIILGFTSTHRRNSTTWATGKSRSGE